MSRVLLILLVSLVFISACTGQQAKFENNGLKINQFTANPTDVSESQNVDFALEIENVGSTTASNIVAELINAKNIWSGDTATKSVPSMKPGSSKDNTPGDIRFFQWTARPPDLPEGVVAPLDVKARVTYDYSSTQAIIVKAINTNQQRILENRGESVTNPIIVAQDDFSPLKVQITKGPIPVIVDPEDPTPSVATYRLEIVNVGDGWPITFNEIGFVSGRISAAGPGISLSDCSGGTGDFNSAGATLRSDGTAPLICTLSIDKGTWAAGPKEDSILFTIELNYKYFVEKSVTVTAHGRGAGSLPSPPASTPQPGPGPTPGPGGGLTLCGVPVADQSTYDKCSSALARKGGNCNGNWCVAPDVNQEFCCITETCRNGYANGNVIQIEQSTICTA